MEEGPLSWVSGEVFGITNTSGKRVLTLPAWPLGIYMIISQVMSIRGCAPGERGAWRWR